MSVVLRIEGRVDESSSEHDGLYLERFDFAGCELGEAVLETTRDIGRARRFASSIEALQCWQQVDPREPVRSDGKANRPLTAFSVSVELQAWG